jgi:acyl-CoA synthetase (AMP-forming)/AMP-acid ligase II
MKRLLNFIKDTDDPAILSEHEAVTFGQILKINLSNEDTFHSLIGARVSLAGNSSSDLAVLLPILDGVVSEILLVPSEFDSQQSDLIEARADSSCRINLEKQKVVVTFIKRSEPYEFLDSKWIIPTSGTTGQPKLVKHSLTSMTRTLKTNVAAGKTLCWGLTYELTRFAGLQVFLQSITTGACLSVPTDGSSVLTKLRFFVRCNVNIISATPSFWRAALMASDTDHLNLRRITLGGEIADKNILNALRSKFPNSKIVHIYASTEAGVGFSVQDCRPGFPVEYLKSSVDGVQIQVEDGKLFIKSKSLSDGYVNKDFPLTVNGFLDTGDLVEISEDRVLFLGRASGLINIGGNKVYPEVIESSLMAHPEVKDCRVYAKSNPILGNLICADIVTEISDSEFGLLKKALIKFCDNRLANYQTPRLFKKVVLIEKNNAGKIIR